MTTEQQLAETIAAPLLATDIGLKLTTFSFTENEGNRVRVVIAAEIDRSQNPGRKLSLAYTVVDSRDQVVSAQVEPEVTLPVRPEPRPRPISARSPPRLAPTESNSRSSTTRASAAASSTRSTHV